MVYGPRRKPVKVEINYWRPEQAKEEFRKRNKIFARLLQEAERQNKQVYVSQMAMVDRQTFIALIGANQDKDFIYKVRAIVQDARIWTFALCKDIIIDLSGVLSRVYYGKNGRGNPWLRNIVVRRLLALKYRKIDAPKFAWDYLDRKRLIFIEGIEEAEALLQELLWKRKKSLRRLGDTKISIAKEIKITSQSPDIKAEEEIHEFTKCFLKYYIVSDTHIADKTAIDNFGEKKAKDFITLLDRIISEQATLIINGDFLELWQAKFGHIKRMYALLFRRLKEVRRIIYIVGNHDEDILKKPELKKALKRLLPRVEILTSWQDMDSGIVLEHGHIADFYNNISWLGRTAAWLAGWIERLAGLISLKLAQKIEPFFVKLGESLLPTKLLVKQGVMHYLERLLALKELFPSDNLILFFGHTHEAVKPKEGPINLLLSQVYGSERITYINTGTWVGRSPWVAKKDAWKKKAHLTAFQLPLYKRPEVEEVPQQDLIEMLRPEREINFLEVLKLTSSPSIQLRTGGEHMPVWLKDIPREYYFQMSAYFRRGKEQGRYTAAEELTAVDTKLEAYRELLWLLYLHARDLKGKAILECGCGPATIVELLKVLSEATVVKGVERQRIFVEYAQQQGLDVIEGDLLTIPRELKGQQFDVTFSNRFFDALKRHDGYSLEHEEALRVLQTISTLTADGGLSIHVTTADAIPFSREELRGVGFESVGRFDLSGTVLVLRKRNSATPASQSVGASSPVGESAYSVERREYSQEGLSAKRYPLNAENASSPLKLKDIEGFEQILVEGRVQKEHAAKASLSPAEKLFLELSERVPRYAPLLRQIVDRIGDFSEMSMLELGAGLGDLVGAIRMHLPGVNIVGIEGNPRRVNTARYQGIALIQGSLTTVPEELVGQTFPLTFSRNVLDALVAFENKLDGFLQSRLMTPDERWQVLTTIATLTTPGLWSLHTTINSIPYTWDKEFQRAGFEIEAINPMRTFVALRKTVSDTFPSSSPVEAAYLFSRNKLFPGQFDVFEDFTQNSFAQILAFVEGYNGTAAIEVTEKDVATFLPDGSEAMLFKNANGNGGFKWRDTTHSIQRFPEDLQTQDEKGFLPQGIAIWLPLYVVAKQVTFLPVYGILLMLEQFLQGHHLRRAQLRPKNLVSASLQSSLVILNITIFLEKSQDSHQPIIASPASYDEETQSRATSSPVEGEEVAEKIKALIKGINLSYESETRDWKVITDNLRQLAEYALAYPEQVRVILDGLRAMSNKDRFIDALAKNDTQKPKFNLGISPENLFPRREISGLLESQNRTAQFKIEAYEYKEDEIRISLLLEPKNEVLASVVIMSSNSLHVLRRSPDLLGFIKDVLWNETSGYYEEQRGYEVYRAYYNLNWMARMTYFEIHPSLRGQGIGEVWYSQYIEPYLRESGFNIVMGLGECLDEEEVVAFWRKQGFSERFPVNQLYDAETVLNYISVKKLTNPERSSSPVGEERQAEGKSLPAGRLWQAIQRCGTLVWQTLVGLMSSYGIAWAGHRDFGNHDDLFKAIALGWAIGIALMGLGFIILRMARTKTEFNFESIKKVFDRQMTRAIMALILIGTLSLFTFYKWFSHKYFFKKGTFFGIIERSWFNEFLAIFGGVMPVLYVFMWLRGFLHTIFISRLNSEDIDFLKSNEKSTVKAGILPFTLIFLFNEFISIGIEKPTVRGTTFSWWDMVALVMSAIFASWLAGRLPYLPIVEREESRKRTTPLDSASSPVGNINASLLWRATPGRIFRKIIIALLSLGMFVNSGCASLLLRDIAEQSISRAEQKLYQKDYRDALYDYLFVYKLRPKSLKAPVNLSQEARRGLVDNYIFSYHLGIFGEEHREILLKLGITEEELRQGHLRADEVASYFYADLLSSEIDELISTLLEHPNPQMRAIAAYRLGQFYFQDARIIEPLMKSAFDSNERVRAASIRALGNTIEPKVFKLFVAALKDKNRDIVNEAITALGKLADPQAVPYLADTLKQSSDNKETKLRIAFALGQMGSADTLPNIN